MTRFMILALTTFAALLAHQITAHAADAKAQGNRPQTSQVDGNSGFVRLVVAQGKTSIVRQNLRNASHRTTVEIEDELPEIANFSDAPSELWHLRPAVRQAQDSLTR